MLNHSLSLLLVTTAISGAADKITYDDDIFPIFESKCLNCHNPDKKKGDLDLSTYTGAMAGSSGGKIALAGDGGSSKLFTVTVHTEEPVMPPEGDKILKKSADLIRAWIDGGLLENKGSKAKKRQKPAFSLGAVPTGKRPEGPPPMPQDLLLEPVVAPSRGTVVADMESSPWAPLLAVTGQKQVLLYHSETLELIGVLPFPKGNPETLSFHPGGKYLLAGGGVGGKSGTTVTWEVTTGKVMMTIGKEFDSVLAADIRADLGGVALGGPSRLIKLWDTQEGEQIQSIKKHTDWVTALAYSPDGVLLATGDRNNGVQIWEAFSGNEFHSLRGHQKAIVDLKWRADSNLVASATEDDTIRFWDMNQGKEVKKATTGSGGVLALDYARNGKLISIGRDRKVKLWKPDLSLEKESKPFPKMLTEVAFSHDTKRYFTADWDGKIEVWNRADLTKVGELTATPPTIQDRLVSLLKEKTTFEAGLTSLRQKITAAQNAEKGARAELTQAEGMITTLKQESAKMQKDANDLAAKKQQFEEQAQAKLGERDQIAKQAKDPAQLKIQIVEERRGLAGEQQKLGHTHNTAKESLVAAASDTSKKREASSKDPQDTEKKTSLAAAEQAEHQHRQVVQELATKVAKHQNLLAAHDEKSKDLESRATQEEDRIQQFTAEHQELVTKQDEAEKARVARLVAMKTQQAKIPEIQKELQPLRVVIQEKEKLAKTVQDELAKASSQVSQFDAQIKKWTGATILTDLIAARSELNGLVLLKAEDPEMAKKISAQQKVCDELAAKYEAAQK